MHSEGIITSGQCTYAYFLKFIKCNTALQTMKSSSLKTKLVSCPRLWIFMVIWMAAIPIFRLGFYLDGEIEFKTPQPYIKSLKVVKSEEKVTNSTKSILYFTPFFGMKDFGFGFGQLPFIKKGCPVTNCFATDNKTLFSKYLLACYGGPKNLAFSWSSVF